MARAMSGRREPRAQRIRRAVERFGPYQSLALLAVPTCIVEPMKLIALAVAGEGHWFTGTVVIIGAYLTSFLLIERLFRIVKPRLLKLGWFARIWSWFVAIRSKLVKPFQSVGR